MSYGLSSAVEAMKDLHLEGNIIPMEWFSRIIFDNGKPDTNAILILSDIVYWYRPSVVRDERTGLVTSYRKKFKADLLQKNYQDYETLFGLSKKQIRDAFVRLEEIGVIRRVLRTVETSFGIQGNVMFIELFPERLRMITHKAPPLDIEIGSSLHERKELPTSKSTPLDIDVNTYTKITPKTTPKITSPGRDNVSDSMLEIWNKTLQPSLPVQMTPARSSRLKAVLAKHFQGELSPWQSFCHEITRSPFLMGQGQRGWRVSLDWILEPRNLQKTLEGNYRSGKAASLLIDPSPSLAEMRLKAQTHIDSLENGLSQEFCRTLLRYLPEAKYLRWFEGIEMSEWQDSRLILSFPSKAVRDYVERHFSSEIGAAARSVSEGIQWIEYEFRAAAVVSLSSSPDKAETAQGFSPQTSIAESIAASGNSVATGFPGPQSSVLYRQKNASTEESPPAESNSSPLSDDYAEHSVNLPAQQKVFCLWETAESLCKRDVCPQPSGKPDESTVCAVIASSSLQAEPQGECLPADVLSPESLIKKTCEQVSGFRDKHFSMEFHSDVSAQALPPESRDAQNMDYPLWKDDEDHRKTAYGSLQPASTYGHERSLP